MRILLSFSLLLLFHLPNVQACGYNWVGDCSSSIHLRINSSLDSFNVADCPSGIPFQGLHLGTIQSLALVNTKAITWESCLNNVTGVELFYRIYEQGGGAGNFQSMSLNQDYFTLEGPYTTRYRSKPGNLDLVAGLTIGKTYVLEVYLQAAIDTLGDDFIPETLLLKNNNGQNYRISFTYGGPTANPFVVIPTKVKNPKCYGESNGSIGVSVWGDQSGLFYNWSNVNLNFSQQNGLPAGTYTVTVSGTNHTESATIVLQQPVLLHIENTEVQPIGCGGGQGSIEVQASGGTAPYQYLWSTGATTAQAGFQVSGNYTVSVTDAFQCIHIQTINLPNTGIIQANSSINLCTGQLLMIGGTLIQAAGNYTLTLPGNGACDTLLNLTVTETNPALLLTGLPSSEVLTCNTPAINFCATSAAGVQYQWSKNGANIGQDPCFLASSGGVYSLSVLQNDCIASVSIDVDAYLDPPTATYSGGFELGCDPTPVPFLLKAVTNAASPVFQWTYDGQTLSVSDSCWFTITEYETIPPGILVPVLPKLLVTNQYGCSAYATPMVTITISQDVPVIQLSQTEASGPNTADGMATLEISGSGAYDILWSTGDSVLVLNNLLPGLYCVTVTGSNDCAVTACIMVQWTSKVLQPEKGSLSIFPNPAAPGDWLQLSLPEIFVDEWLQVALVDLQGKNIQTAIIPKSAPKVQFQLPKNLDSGIYALRLSSEKGQISEKICVKK